MAIALISKSSTTPSRRVLFTFLWSFSGGYHAFTKLVTAEDVVIPPTAFSPVGVCPDMQKLAMVVGHSFTNFRVVNIGGRLYWRVSLAPGAATDLVYVRADDYSVLPDGDQQYAEALAVRYSGRAGSGITGVTPVTAFDDEYNFSDKRLPVWRVNYGGRGHERWYVETCSGELAARVDDAVYAEGYSFSVFHKHHFMDWGGKTVRDASTMFWAFAQVVMVVAGLLLFFRFRK